MILGAHIFFKENHQMYIIYHVPQATPTVAYISAYTHEAKSQEYTLQRLLFNHFSHHQSYLSGGKNVPDFLPFLPDCFSFYRCFHIFSLSSSRFSSFHDYGHVLAGKGNTLPPPPPPPPAQATLLLMSAFSSRPYVY